MPRKNIPPAKPLPSTTVSTVSVRLGGEFALLSEAEERYKTLLANAEDVLASSQSALAAERSRAGALQVALERSAEFASDAGAAAVRAQNSAADLEVHALSYHTSAQTLLAEAVALEAANASLTERATEDAAALELVRDLLAAQNDRSAALGAALADANTALEASQAREAQLRKELDEERQRSKRFAAARAEKEKQLAVTLCEKNRISQLLSKKDTLARDLSATLKSVEHQNVQKAAQLQAQQQQRRIAKAQAALAIGEAAAEQALPSPKDGEDVVIPSMPARGGALLVTNPDAAADVAARMTPRAPGAPRRFEGWRDATPAQREAALRTENAVLIGVLAERDAALAKSDAEMRRLRTEHASMLTRWRGAVGRTADEGSAATAAAAAPKRATVAPTKREVVATPPDGRKSRPNTAPMLAKGAAKQQAATPPGGGAPPPAVPSPLVATASPPAVPTARLHAPPTRESPA